MRDQPWFLTNCVADNIMSRKIRNLTCRITKTCSKIYKEKKGLVLDSNAALMLPKNVGRS